MNSSHDVISITNSGPEPGSLLKRIPDALGNHNLRIPLKNKKR